MSSEELSPEESAELAVDGIVRTDHAVYVESSTNPDDLPIGDWLNIQRLHQQGDENGLLKAAREIRRTARADGSGRTSSARPAVGGLREVSDRDAVAALIGEHSWDMTDEIRVDGVWTWVLCCECGEMPPMAEGHQHIADGILRSDWLANQRSTAREQGRAEGEAEWAAAVEGLAFIVCPDLTHTHNEGHDECEALTTTITATLLTADHTKALDAVKAQAAREALIEVSVDSVWDYDDHDITRAAVRAWLRARADQIGGA